MAAPAEKTMRNLSGKWFLNKTLSDSPEPGLALQGIGFFLRKSIGLASITVTVNQYEAPPKPPNTSTDIFTHIDSEQTAAGLTSTQEHRCLDNSWRPHSDWLFGSCRGRSHWVSFSELDDEFLKKGWKVDGEEIDKTLVYSFVESDNNGWTATQVWGFQIVNGERRHCRNILIQKDGQRAEFRFVYDYLPEV
ncbi:hypothetical protein S7711_08457 [Stachybotrys chartarum IBT 7711]|uniref:Lipocalin-like domain-containing protein n=1 Tax=Stachybotrys chartarum (strain CBS 109288 / IBT 7711) TaxID=1280523 RepID=A0A084AGG8_STACB|nr:hypothetical protein S7711_08457 [Stachybotrys chartarum IBT 7711]KFA52699.1 hypothetical protein S40293_08769 [Stachybotrys chartarum IBT 40293]KFA71775.1 hypothetical protein S40288_07430 [Stachybotrys chartarum IBT 40288]